MFIQHIFVCAAAKTKSETKNLVVITDCDVDSFIIFMKIPLTTFK